MADQSTELRDLLLKPRNLLDSHPQLVIPNQLHRYNPNQWLQYLSLPLLSLNTSRHSSNLLSQSASLHNYKWVSLHNHKWASLKSLSSLSSRQLAPSVKLLLLLLNLFNNNKATKYYLHPASHKFTHLNLNLALAWAINLSTNNYLVCNLVSDQSWQWSQVLQVQVNQWWPCQLMGQFTSQFNNNQAKLSKLHNTG